MPSPDPVDYALQQLNLLNGLKGGVRTAAVSCEMEPMTLWHMVGDTLGTISTHPHITAPWNVPRGLKPHLAVYGKHQWLRATSSIQEDPKWVKIGHIWGLFVEMV